MTPQEIAYNQIHLKTESNTDDKILSINFLNPMLQDLQNNVSPYVLSIIRRNVANPVCIAVESNVSNVLFLSSYR